MLSLLFSSEITNRKEIESIMVSTRNALQWFRRSLFLLTAVVSLGLGRTVQATVITRDVNVILNASNLESYNLDLDLDGVNDFEFTAAFVPDPLLSVGFDVVDFPFGSNNGVIIDAAVMDGFPTASRLNEGDLVSPSNIFSSASFDQANLFFFVSPEPPTGNFEGQTGFIGLRFDSLGGILYGFAQVSVNARTSSVNPLGLTIGTVGYNNAVGQSVQIPAVPEPTSLLVFGMGGLGILSTCFTRKRRSLAN